MEERRREELDVIRSEAKVDEAPREAEVEEDALRWAVSTSQAHDGPHNPQFWGESPGARGGWVGGVV